MKWLIVALAFAMAPTFAKTCDGDWRIELDSQRTGAVPVGSGTNEELDVWLSATINVDRSLLPCVDQVSIRPQTSNQIELKGPQTNLATIVYSEDYTNLRTRGTGYVVPVNQQKTKVWFRVPNGVIAPAGYYHADIAAQITGINNSKPRRFSLRHRVEPVMSMRVPTLSQPWLSKSGMNYYVDMGEMTEGSTRNIDLEIKSNALVDVKVKSRNGALQHRQRDAQIDYSISFDGAIVPKTGVLNTTLAPRGNNVVLNVPFVISVDPQPYAYAGKYEDVVTVVMRAK